MRYASCSLQVPTEVVTVGRNRFVLQSATRIETRKTPQWLQLSIIIQQRKKNHMTNYRLLGYKVPTMGNITCLTALLIALLAKGTSQQRVTCDAGQFNVGQNASLTCNFNHSVENTGHQIYVMHYPFSASDRFSEKRILRCLRSDDLQPICEVAEGIQWKGNITDRLTLHIPDVTADFGGLYMCQLMPPDGMIMTVCNLTVEETPAQNSSIARSGSWTAFIIVTSTFFGLVAIAALSMCIYIIRRWRLRDEKERNGLGCPLNCRTHQQRDEDTHRLSGQQ